MNQYETVFIANPVLSAQQMKEAVEKFRNIIVTEKAEMVHEEDWGLRKLAYPIQKKSTGFYHLFEFKCDGSTINKLETEFRRDERIMRFLTVKLGKYAAIYSDKKRSMKKETETKKEE